MAGESAIPGTEAGWAFIGTARSVLREFLVIKSSFEDGTIEQNDARSNDRGFGVETMFGAIS
jgi:hypothetical protein